MNRIFLYGVVALCLSCPFLNTSAQSMSHEEEVVRNAYAKFSFLCSMPPVTKAAASQWPDDRIDQVKLDAEVANATPIFELTGFQTGPIASIANESWGTFVTPPQQQGEVLVGQMETQGYSDNGNGTTWEMANVRWKPSPQISPETERFMLSKTVAEIIKIGSPQWQPANMLLVTYTRYAEFTVDVTFQGKSSGPHKAIFFFGTDVKGKEYLAVNDPISSQGSLANVANNPAETEPTGLLMNKLRETPIIANWLRANVVSDSSCSQTTMAMCCAHGHCGISSAAFNHALATPLPSQKN